MEPSDGFDPAAMNYFSTQTAPSAAALSEDSYANMLLPIDYGHLGYVA